MPSMSVWFVWNQRTSAVCAWEGCQELLGAVEPAIQGVLYYQSGPSRRFRWHPKCYIAQGLAYLEEHPPEPPKQTKRSTKHFTPEQQQVRHALIAKKSRIKKLKEQAVENGFWWKMQSLEEATRDVNQQLQAMEGVDAKEG